MVSKRLHRILGDGVAFYLLCVVTSCSPLYEEKLSAKLSECIPAERLMKYKNIVFIPNGGCAGCIQEAENFYIESKSDITILFVFTNFLSRKDLQIKLGKDLPQKSNVWLDNDNSFYFPQYSKSLYPCVIFLTKGKACRFANLDEIVP